MDGDATMYVVLTHERQPRSDLSKALCTIQGVGAADIPRAGDEMELVYTDPDDPSELCIDIYHVDRVVFHYSGPAPQKGKEWIFNRSEDENRQLDVYVHFVRRQS